jgi:NAD(P)-dependent dehydrogenase (short-subunit alcohol dehydrogenase family)
MSNNGKVAIVTGAAKGIGLAIVRKLLSAGGRVVVNDIDSELLHEVVHRLHQEGYECTAVKGDSSDPAVIRHMVQTAVHSYGRLDTVIANAGITLFGDFLSYNADDFRRVMEVNLSGTFFLVQAAVRQMKQQGSGGSILMTSSVTAHQAHKDLAAYSMTKAALEMLARNLVAEISSFGISINCIAPGATLTERTLEDRSYASTWSKITPTGRPSTVEDIAHAAAFLVSDEARQITGQSLVIDGGWTCISPGP